MATKANKNSVKEPSVVIRPVGNLGGLDNIHLAMGVLIIILIGLLVAVAFTKPAAILTTNSSAMNCTYGSLNGKCAVPMHNASQIRTRAESFLASYNNVNTSLSLLPYVSNVSRMNISYSAQTGQWQVSFPATNPATNTTFQFAMDINDSNMHVVPLIQTIAPPISTNNTVVAKGVVQIAGQPACSNSTPLQLYWFVDPYSPGGIASLGQMVQLQNKYQSNVSIGVKILFTQYSQNIAATYGLNSSLALSSYLFCASEQSSFPNFLNVLNRTYNGAYLPGTQLVGMASNAGLNVSQLNSCVASAGTIINRQAILAKYYNVTSSPAIVTDCRYLSIPQTTNAAIIYADKSIT